MRSKRVSSVWHDTEMGIIKRNLGFHNVLNVGFKSVRHMKAYKKHQSSLLSQQDLQQQQQRNSCSEIRKPIVWDSYHKRTSVGSSSGAFWAGIPHLPQTSRPSRERIRVRSSSLGRLHNGGHPDTAEEPRLQPPHLAAFSTFS